MKNSFILAVTIYCVSNR